MGSGADGKTEPGRLFSLSIHKGHSRRPYVRQGYLRRGYFQHEFGKEVRRVECQDTDIKDSIVNSELRVYGSKNLFLSGCNIIPTCNPTLTAMCFAIIGANVIVKELKDQPAMAS
jgi:hypothetical protein